MTQDDAKFEHPLEPVRKANEEEYFHRQNMDLAQKLKAKRAFEALGVSDTELQTRLTQIGYDADTARVIFLIPLLEVAWADGRVEEEESSEILNFVHQLGIEPASKASTLVSKWLKALPNDALFENGKEYLAPFVKTYRKAGKDLAASILEACEHIADASHGIFGFFPGVSSVESDILKKIAERVR
jgi:hypothetical protein